MLWKKRWDRGSNINWKRTAWQQPLTAWSQPFPARLCSFGTLNRPPESIQNMVLVAGIFIVWIFIRIFKILYNCTWTTFWGNIFGNLLKKFYACCIAHSWCLFCHWFVVDRGKMLIVWQKLLSENKWVERREVLSKTQSSWDLTKKTSLELSRIQLCF